MIRDEVLKLLSIYSAAYPMAELNEEQIELWVTMLQETTFEKGQINMRNHILSNRFPPTIADIFRRHDPEQFTDYEQLRRETELFLQNWEERETNAIACPPELSRKHLMAPTEGDPDV